MRLVSDAGSPVILIRCGSGNSVIIFLFLASLHIQSYWVSMAKFVQFMKFALVKNLGVMGEFYYTDNFLLKI